MNLYRFINKDEEIIYIGKTKHKNIRKRLNQHFGNNGHLSNECYSEVIKVEYAKINSESDLIVYEPYYINLYNPKYNVELKKSDMLTIKLPDLVWKEIDIKDNKFNFEYDFERMIGCMLFKTEQEKLIKDLNAKENNKLLKTMRDLNWFFDDNEVYYRIEAEYDLDKISDEGYKNKNYGKLYWMIKRY